MNDSDGSMLNPVKEKTPSTSGHKKSGTAWGVPVKKKVEMESRKKTKITDFKLFSIHAHYITDGRTSQREFSFQTANHHFFRWQSLKNFVFDLYITEIVNFL